MDREVATNREVDENREVEVTKASSLQKSTGQTEGMIRQGAIIDQSDKLCASGKSRDLCNRLVVVADCFTSYDSKTSNILRCPPPRRAGYRGLLSLWTWSRSHKSWQDSSRPIPRRLRLGSSLESASRGQRQ